MKKRKIIKSSLEYTEIIKTCPYKKNSYFIIYYRKNNQENRYGISIPKKTGKANIRNKVKRRLKNIIDTNEFSIHTPYDYVIIVRKRLLELNYQEIETNLMNLIEKIGDNNEEKK